MNNNSKGASNWCDVRSHWRSLFSVHPDTAVLDGWRGLSMLLVFIFHLFFTLQELVPFWLFQNFYHATHWSLLWVWAGDRGVDIFFVLSGFLIGSGLLKEWQASGEILLGRFWLRRLLRLAPVYYLVLSLYWLVSGPNAESIWANFLYVNNYLGYEDGAMLWSWSLAVEMQFYVLLPLFLLSGFLCSAPFIRWLAILILLLLAVFFRVQALYSDDWLMKAQPWQFLLDEPTFKHFFEVFYDNFETRFGSLLLGFIAAYLAIYHRLATVGWLNRWYGFVVIVVALVVVLLLTLLPGFTYRMEGGEGLVFSSAEGLGQGWQFVYLVGHRYVYSFAVAALILYSLMGRGWLFGGLKYLLSFRIWVPFARLSYSIYLIHIIVIFAVYQSALSVDDYRAIGNADYLAFNFGGLAVLAALMTIAIAVCLYIFVERPFMQLRR